MDSSYRNALHVPFAADTKPYHQIMCVCLNLNTHNTFYVYI